MSYYSCNLAKTVRLFKLLRTQNLSQEIRTGNSARSQKKPQLNSVVDQRRFFFFLERDSDKVVYVH